MTMMSKNSRVGRDRSGFYKPDSDCLKRFNYSNGAGWRTKNKGKLSFKIKSFHPGTGRSKFTREG